MGQPAMEAEDRTLVLVADDDEMERLLLQEALEQAGFAVETVADGQAAIEAAERLRPDIILLDVVMPGLDGFDACTTLRRSANCRHTPILLVTGADDIESIQRAYEAGATDFMSKPINWTILCHRVHYMHRASTALDDLRTSEARLAEAQKIAQLGSWTWEQGGDRFSGSEETYRILGFAKDGPSLGHGDLLGRIHEDDRDHVEAMIGGAIGAGRGFAIDCRTSSPDGPERIIAIKADVAADGGDGSGRLIGTCQDITDRKRIEARIHHMAHHDALTDLPNRVLFLDRLKQALVQAKRDATMVAVLCLDLDRFKEINDTLGHGIGDQLLRAVSARIQDVVRGSDTVARLGGDEFAVVQAGVKQPQGAQALSSRLIDAIHLPFEVEGHKVLIGTSIGISVFPSDSEQADRLIMNADIALYRAKGEGRGQFCCFEVAMEQSLIARKAMEQDLRRGLEEGWFVLHYQPQFRVEDGQIVGAEALLRMQHPDYGLVPPGDFIPVAEDTGLIVPIGDWALRTACRQVAEWSMPGSPPFRMAVNLSPIQFRDVGLVSSVAAALGEVGLDASRLELEITESTLMRNTDETIDALRQLQSLGVRVAMDDFGTGYSSLSYLKLFPFDRIKIDRSFVEELNRDADATAIFRAIVSLGRHLRMCTTAEGVETPSQFAVLKDEGCDEVQGFLLGRPVTAEEFFTQIRELKNRVA